MSGGLAIETCRALRGATVNAFYGRNQVELSGVTGPFIHKLKRRRKHCVGIKFIGVEN